MDNLSLAIELHGQEVVLRLVGSLDLASGPCLRTALDGVLESRPKRVVLDLAGVDLLDSAAIGVVVTACKSLRRRGGDLVLRAPRPSVALVLDTVGLQRTIEIEPALAPPAA